MNKQQRIKHGFVSLLYGMSACEQHLLLMISNQTKIRNVLRFEGKIEIGVESYKDCIKELSDQPPLSVVVRGLLEKSVDLSDNDEWNLLPLVQEVGSCHNGNKIFISFNQNLIGCLSDIESILNYDLKDAQRVTGAAANQFYRFIAKYLNQGDVRFSLKELQEKFGGLHGLSYFTKHSVDANVNVINNARTSIKIGYKMEENPNEDNNPLFTFSVVTNYD